MKKLIVLALVLGMVSSVCAAAPAPSTADMMVWLKGNSGVVADTSGSVSAWNDASGQGNDFKYQIVGGATGFTTAFGPLNQPAAGHEIDRH